MKHVFLILSLSIMAAISLASTSFSGEGDAVKGQKLFKKCKACHTADEGGKKRMGPNLFGIFGKKSGQREGYKYSKALLAANLTWDEATLDTWLTKPKALVKGTKMTLPIKKPAQRANLIAYLKTLR